MTSLSVPKLNDEAGRLAALRRYEMIDTEAEQEFEDIIGLVRSFFGLPIAAISLLDANRQWFKASVGLAGAETPRSVAFCHHTIESARTMAVEDATRDPRFAANPLVTAPPRIRCYLGVPLTTPDGYNIGTLCVLGTQPRSFTPAEEEVLKNFGRLVMSLMELRLLAQRDALTGTLGRTAFEQVLRAAFRQCKNDDAAMSLLMMDIDHFKSINDEYGHRGGPRDQSRRAGRDWRIAPHRSHWPIRRRGVRGSLEGSQSRRCGRDWGTHAQVSLPVENP